MIVRELLASFGLKLDEHSFHKAHEHTESLKDSLKELIEIIAVVEIAEKFEEIVDGSLLAAVAVAQMAEKVGVGTDALQELRYAAKQSGIEVEEFDKALTLMTRASGEAASGNAEAAKKFAEIGVSVKDSNGHIKRADVLFGNIADKMEKATSQTERLKIATDFFGVRGGSKFALLMKEGSAGLERFRQEARDLGGVMDAEMIEKSEEAHHNFNRLSFAIDGIKNSITAALLPTIIAVTDVLVEWVKTNKDLIKAKTKEWIESAVKGAKTLLSALMSFVHVGQAALSMIGGLQNALIALGVAFGVYLLAQIGEAVAGLAVFSAAELAVKLAVLGDAILMGAAFIALASIIFMLGEEISAAFDPNKIGLFEEMQGKWGDLSRAILDDTDLWDGSIKSLGHLLLLFASLFAGGWDAISDAIFQQLTAIGAAWDTIIFAIENSPQRIINAFKSMHLDQLLPGFLSSGASLGGLIGGGPSASPAAVAAGAQTTAASTSVSVHVDASGQTFDESSLAAKIGTHVNEALATSHRQAMEALTPVGAQ